MVIQVSNVPDRVIEILLEKLFRQEALKTEVDKSLRVALLKEHHRRTSKSPATSSAVNSELFPGYSEEPLLFLAWLPELKPFPLMIASFSIVGKIIEAVRMALEDRDSGRQIEFRELEAGVNFLIEILIGLQESAKSEVQREMRKWN